jgi:hypothetical protein
MIRNGTIQATTRFCYCSGLRHYSNCADPILYLLNRVHLRMGLAGGFFSIFHLIHKKKIERVSNHIFKSQPQKGSFDSL